MKRTRLRRTPTKTRTKRQCQAGVADPNAVGSVAPGVAAPDVSAAPEVAAPPAESAAPEEAPVAAEPAAAEPAAAPEDDGESLSDFTR
jgi:predicted component of type VI protein secretion system